MELVHCLKCSSSSFYPLIPRFVLGLVHNNKDRCVFQDHKPLLEKILVFCFFILVGEKGKCFCYGNSKLQYTSELGASPKDQRVLGLACCVNLSNPSLLSVCVCLNRLFGCSAISGSVYCFS
uniref:Uncharacterized protein n=1 Tax=Kalanchoe fedtschenkoi TaxID=63787 RepID=A0A7N0RF95_KALFE